MTFRRTVFWTHLAAGLVTALFIGLMSITSVLLTYERQMIRWAQDAAVSAPAGEAPLTFQGLVDAAAAEGAQAGHVVTVPDGRSGAVHVAAGRRNAFLLDPYTGDRLEGAGEGMEAFFGRVMHIHRWLAFTGGRNDLGAAINGAANLAFAALILTGLYLWWPKVWRWAFLKTQLLFRRHYPSAKARHYNWHHVMGFWMALPLLAITLTGAVFSYGWANALVYAAFGESVPVRGGPPVPAGTADSAPDEPRGLAGEPVSLDALVARAIAETGPGRRIAITLPEEGAETVRISVDHGNGVQASLIDEVVVFRDGSGLATATPARRSPAAEARRYIRFLHTGEIYGLAGQTLAGLASLFAVLLVYTGACLGVTRLRRMWRER
ncbi:PepSY domain-containing protein [Maricaulis sp.]|uniref:PepSY-associated TM helix domain-containing protein n=1 Tax=Maricaulis sp. TaxID=1486257 RepID=UPI001B0CE94A|nr:PepSY-associated TM helix domain-containing protein [Maricaulis sp.]MBO6764460.1 PepSY domain-containing protein [Maricaulis sp.]